LFVSICIVFDSFLFVCCFGVFASILFNKQLAAFSFCVFYCRSGKANNKHAKGIGKGIESGGP